MSVNIWNATEQKLEQVGGNVNINDSVVSENSTFSSKKINDSLGDLEKNYGKKEIADCNTVEETISYIAPNTLHSPKAEGLTKNARGILISAIREAPDDYCVQTAILNGSSQHFTRCKLPNNDWQPWKELATMDKVNASLGELTFGQTDDGKWGYKPTGADSVIPFKSGAEFIGGYGYTQTVTLPTSGDYILSVISYSSAGASTAQGYTGLKTVSDGTFEQLTNKTAGEGYSLRTYKVTTNSDNVVCTFGSQTNITVTKIG